MIGFWSWIKRNSQVKYEESEGIAFAIQTVEKYSERTFEFRGPGMKYSGIPAEEIIRFMREEVPEYYNYYTNVKTYLDRGKIQQAEIEITGTIGMRGKSGRYNPLDRKFFIATEKLKANNKHLVSQS
jgi:hypothetical protein